MTGKDLARFPLALDPVTTSLLLVDMQHAFGQAGGTTVRGGQEAAVRAAVRTARRLVVAARRRSIPDIWTVQHHYDPDLARDRRFLPSPARRAGRPPAALRGTWDAAIVDELADLVTPETEVVVKHRHSAFFDTRLATLLRSRGIRTLVVAGFTTPLCVEATVRDAAQHDHDVVVVSDATAAPSEEFHQASLRVIRTYFGVVLASEQVLDLLEGATVPVDLHRS